MPEEQFAEDTLHAMLRPLGQPHHLLQLCSAACRTHSCMLHTHAALACPAQGEHSARQCELRRHAERVAVWQLPGGELVAAAHSVVAMLGATWAACTALDTRLDPALCSDQCSRAAGALRAPVPGHLNHVPSPPAPQVKQINASILTEALNNGLSGWTGDSSAAGRFPQARFLFLFFRDSPMPLPLPLPLPGP